MPNKKTLLLCALCLQSLLLYPGSDEIIKIDKGDGLKLIGTSAYFLVDSSRSLTFEEVLLPENQSRFRLGTTAYTNYPSSALNYWIRFTVRNGTGENLELRIGKGWIAEVDFFSPQQNGGYKQIHTGYFRPFSSRPLLTNQYRFPLHEYSEDSAKTFYVKLRTWGYALEAPLYVGTTTDLELDQQKEDWFAAMYSGAAIIMTLFSLISFLGSRELPYLYYMLYLLTLLFMIPYLTGAYPQYWLFREWGSLNFYYFFIVGFNPLFIVLFIQTFLRIRWQDSIQLKIAYLLCILTMIMGVVNLLTGSTGNYHLWLPIFSTSFLLIGSLFYLSILILVFTALIRGKRQARYLMIGWSTYFMGVWLAIAAYELEMVELTFYTTKAIMFGSFFEIIMFSLALADNVNMLKREKEEAQLREIAQARENKRLIQRENQLLESEVGKRTQELKLKNAELSMKELDLKEVVSEKELLMKVVAHDLKSPLNVIEGFASLLSVEAGASSAKETERLAREGKSVIENILKISSKSIPEEELEEIDFEKLLRYVLDQADSTSSFGHSATELKILSDERMLVRSERRSVEAILSKIGSDFLFDSNGKDAVVEIGKSGTELHLKVITSSQVSPEECGSKLFDLQKLGNRVGAVITLSKTDSGLELAVQLPSLMNQSDLAEADKTI